jgi:DNA sulfur modification protein DndD
LNITRIRVHNFGPFYGDHELVFPENGSGVHIIRGNTGQGKTSLQRAILWALYGNVKDRRGKDIVPTSLLNFIAQKEKKFDFHVNIHFNQDGKEWVISRQMSANAHQDSLYQKNLVLSVTEEGVAKTGNPQQYIERIIPHDLSRFYFFDGEMLREYENLLEQESDSIKVLKNSIEHILGIPYLVTARDDLKQIQTGFERDRARMIRTLGGRDYEQLSEDYDGICDSIESCDNNIARMNKQIQEVEHEIYILKRTLVDLEPIHKLAEEQIKLEGDIKQKNEKINAELLKIQPLNANLYKNILSDVATNIITKFNEIHEIKMEKYNKKQYLLKQFRDIEESINKVKCYLCGHVLDFEELSSLESQKKVLNADIETLTEIPEPNLEYERYKLILENMMKTQINREEYFIIENTKIKLEYDIAILQTRLSDIKAKLKDVDDDEPSRIISNISKLDEELGRLKASLETERKTKETDLDIKSKLDQQLSSINKEELNIIKKRIETVKKISTIFNDAITMYREIRRQEVQAESTRIFRQLRSKDYFDSLQINDNYGLYILTKGGDMLNKAEWRSAGEEQIVAFALVGALNRCTQIEAPIFMDTPFSRLDLTHGSKVISYVPTMAQQVVLLVTDRELRYEDEKNLSGYVKSDHTLIHRGEDRGSFIIKTPIGG